MNERLALYTATEARLKKQIAELSRGRRRLVWLVPLTIVCSAFAMPFNLWLAAGAATIGFTLYGVGTYIATVHLAEDRHALAKATRELDAIRSK